MADLNRATSISSEELDDVFDYHQWDDEQKESGQRVRDALKEAFAQIIENVPPCPTRTVALRKITEARMDANAAITHRGKY
jgi:hypothetical protein